MSKEVTLDTIKQKLYVENEYNVRYQDPYLELSLEEQDFLRRTLNLPKNWHKSCLACMARQKIKYGENKIPCTGIINTLPDGSAEVIDKLMQQDGITKERAKLVLRATQDPVAWCELMFGFDDKTKNTEEEWYLRAYQKEQIRCSSKRIVIREGRRAGKSFAMACKLIHSIFNVKVPKGSMNGVVKYNGPQIMIVTPYQAQINAIFKELEDLLLKCPELASEVTSGNNGSLYAKTPPLTMEFKNGGIIKGFVSGVGLKMDGSSGGTIRGQSADIIYLDEMDMIPDKILKEAILPIMATRRNTKLIATSTPIGRRSSFYKWCMQDPSFKEDHLPTTVLPQWDENKDLLLGDSNKETIMTEYMAQFVEGGTSVFRLSWIKEALREYETERTINPRYLRDRLGVLRPEKMIKCLGIDWNKNAGTEFFVTGYDPDAHRWIELEAVNISQSEFSSIKWKEEVIRLNYKWNLDYIYADDGYGHTIIEDLQVYSLSLKGKAKATPREVATSKIVDIMKSFNFSSKVTLRSPVDGREIQKGSKDFLVENAMRIFEDQKFVFPFEDKQLQKELSNYTILRRSPTSNKPIYGAEDKKIGDHRLDAWMLSLGGLFLELSEYSPNMFGTGGISHVDEKTLEQREKGVKGTGTMEFIADMEKYAPNVNLTGIRVYGENGKVLNEIDYDKKEISPRRRGANTSSVLEHFKSLPRRDDPDTFTQESSHHIVTRRRR